MATHSFERIPSIDFLHQQQASPSPGLLEIQKRIPSSLLSKKEQLLCDEPLLLPAQEISCLEPRGLCSKDQDPRMQKLQCYAQQEL
ncbi:hypothetical protein D3C84_1016990 [compost metagenome]